MSNTARTLSVISSAFSLLVLVCCSYVELKKSQVYVLIQIQLGGVINPLNPNPNIGALAGVGLGSIF
jgi:hypothetical protein